jgi:hypothetical protein
VPGGNAFSDPGPAFISVDGGMPPLSTGASLPEYAGKEPKDNNPVTIRAVIVDLFMMKLLRKLLT